MKKLWLLLLAFTLAAGAVWGDEPPFFAIRNARIVPVSGPVIENGTVVIERGLISAAGANVTVPPAALVIDGKGLTIYPGLIDALSTVGLPEGAATGGQGGRPGGAGAPGQAPAQAPGAAQARPAQGPEDRPATTPWVHAADQVNAADRRIEAARNAGFTTALVSPTRGIFAGFGSVINLAGERSGDLVVKSPAALYVTFSSSGFGGGFPGSLMGAISYVKQTFMDARHYRAAWAAYKANPRGRTRPAYDRALEELQPAIGGDVPVLLPATSEVELRRYLELGRQLDVRFAFYGAHEAYAAAALLAERKAPVLVSAKWPEKARDGDPEQQDSLRTLRLRDRAPSTPAALHKAGVPFAFYSDGIANLSEVRRNVKRAIDAGLPADAAIRALTLAPAQIFGVSQSFGSIEPGKVANLVVADGDLFAERTRIKYVFVDGRRFNVPEEAQQPDAGGPGGAGRRGAPSSSGQAAEAPPNVSGTWKLTVDSPQGPIDVTASLRQEGTAVSGTVSSHMGNADIVGGSVDGNQLRFTVRLGDGREFTFTGTLSGSGITGTLAMPGGDAIPFKGSKGPAEDQETAVEWDGGQEVEQP